MYTHISEDLNKEKLNTVQKAVSGNCYSYELCTILQVLCMCLNERHF